MKLTLLPSDKGDCILLESPDKTTILIDGGMLDSYTGHVREFVGRWRQKNKRPLDLVYLSHIDQDHIAGILQLMNDLVAWRVYRHKKAKGEKWPKPDFLEPPEIKGLWHNAFHDMVGDNAGEIASMLAASAAQLSNSSNPATLQLAAAYQAIAASVPEAIRLSRRVSAKQLNIPLNKEFGGKLAMVRTPAQNIRLNGATSPLIRILGPFKDDLENLRKVWNKWLTNEKNKATLTKLRKSLRDEDARFDSGVVALDVDDDLGERKKVTEENLASLMLMVEHGGKTILLTGDGHYADILRGLEHNGVLSPGKGMHVNLLKIQHHGSEHNFKREFAKRITADHYVICGNGLHDNPDTRVLDVLALSRLGSGDEKSGNPEVDQPFEVWFNCSVAFLQQDIAKRKKEGRPFAKYEGAAKHFAEVEKTMKTHKAKAGGKMKLHYLDDAPLVLNL
jgi:beta-lactamase superfamily II metal-dependent hydrolase